MVLGPREGVNQAGEVTSSIWQDPPSSGSRTAADDQRDTRQGPARRQTPEDCGRCGRAKMSRLAANARKWGNGADVAEGDVEDPAPLAEVLDPLEQVL